MDQQEEVQQEASQEVGQAEEAQVETAAGEYDKGDYEARALNDPEFALKQIKDWTREAYKARDEVKSLRERYGTLEPFVNAVGVDGLEQYIQAGVSVMSNPQLTELYNEFARTGHLPNAARQEEVEDDGDPYEDPSVTALRKELREAKDALSKMQGDYNQRFAQAETRSLQGGIEKNISRVMEMYGINDEVRERISKEINSRVTQGQKAAQTGDQQALQMLSMLAGDQGEETLKRIIAPVVLDPDTMRAIASARETKKAQSVAQQSTGSPSAARTAGGGDEPAAVKYGPGFVREALEKATKNAGRDPNRLW